MSRPLLAAQGCRVIVPYLRGLRARRAFTMRRPHAPAEQAAIGADLMALMDALSISAARCSPGYDWGGRGGVQLALRCGRERCIGLVSVNSLSDPGTSRTRACGRRRRPREGPAVVPMVFSRSSAAAARACRGTVAAITRNFGGSSGSPNWHFDEAMLEADLDRARQSRLCRHRHPQLSPIVTGLAEGDPSYADIQHRLATFAADHGPGPSRWTAMPMELPVSPTGSPSAAKIHRPP